MGNLMAARLRTSPAALDHLARQIKQEEAEDFGHLQPDARRDEFPTQGM